MTDASETTALPVPEIYKRAWLRTIQTDNQCQATGLPCRDPEQCGCVLEQREIVGTYLMDRRAGRAA